MYCKHCGKEISNDSYFCRYCGGSQTDYLTANANEEKEVQQIQEKVIKIPLVKSNLAKKTKWWIVGSGLWVVINLYWLFAGHKRSAASEHFLPFTNKFLKSGYFVEYYDITEFIVYVIGLPLIIWGIYMLVKNRAKKIK